MRGQQRFPVSPDKPELLRRGHFTREGLPTRPQACRGPGHNRSVTEAASTTAHLMAEWTAGRGTSATITLLCRRCRHGRQPPLRWPRYGWGAAGHRQKAPRLNGAAASALPASPHRQGQPRSLRFRGRGEVRKVKLWELALRADGRRSASSAEPPDGRQQER